MTLKHWAIVPVKDAAHAKRRLGPALGALRESFAREMALHTLQVVRASGLFERLIVVTSDSAVRAACASVDMWILDDHGAGLNDACTRGLHLAGSLGADLVSIVHSDIATLDAATLRDVVRQFLQARATADAEAVGLVRCKDGSGTNMVLLDPREPFTPRFGPNSFSVHLHQAGDRAHELAGGEAAFDIDTPGDLDRLLRRAPMADWLKRYAAVRQPRSSPDSRPALGAARRRSEGEDLGPALPQ